MEERREYVLSARFDDTPLPGMLSDMVTVACALSSLQNAPGRRWHSSGLRKSAQLCTELLDSRSVLIARCASRCNGLVDAGRELFSFGGDTRGVFRRGDRLTLRLGGPRVAGDAPEVIAEHDASESEHQLQNILAVGQLGLVAGALEREDGKVDRDSYDDNADCRTDRLPQCLEFNFRSPSGAGRA